MAGKRTGPVRRALLPIATCAAVLAPGAGHADEALDNVFLHVVAHEMGHAMIREFDLPITASEEAMADAFAVVALHHALPERWAGIVTDRAASRFAADGRTDLFGEYPPDARRAGAIVCLALALDPEGFAATARGFGLEGDAAERCLDFGAEIARGWRRTVAPYLMPAGARVTEVGLREDDRRIPEGRPSDGAVDDAMAMLAGIDWHSRVTLVLERCDGGAVWSRNGRTIRICDRYLERAASDARGAR